MGIRTETHVVYRHPIAGLTREVHRGLLREADVQRLAGDAVACGVVVVDVVQVRIIEQAMPVPPAWYATDEEPAVAQLDLFAQADEVAAHV